jgi:hypothetical protein
VVAALLAQWAGDPLVVPYLPHLALGMAALAALWAAPDTAGARGRVPDRWPPAAVRTRRFWLTVGLPAPMVFGSISLAIVVLPAEVTSARSLSAGFAGLVTALAFAAGVGVQPAARRLEAHRAHAGIVAGLAAAAGGAAISVAAVASDSRPLASAGALLFGLAYDCCLVSGLRQAEQLAGPHDRGAVVACYYVLAYLGFTAPYAVAVLTAALGRAGAFTALAGGAALLTGWMWVQAAHVRAPSRPSSSRTEAAVSRAHADSPSSG